MMKRSKPLLPLENVRPQRRQKMLDLLMKDQQWMNLWQPNIAEFLVLADACVVLAERFFPAIQLLLYAQS
jgi:hypothetical protein